MYREGDTVESGACLRFWRIYELVCGNESRPWAGMCITAVLGKDTPKLMKDSDILQLGRRDVLKAAGGIGVAATAGCLDTGGSGSGTYQIGMVDAISGSL